MGSFYNINKGKKIRTKGRGKMLLMNRFFSTAVYGYFGYNMVRYYYLKIDFSVNMKYFLGAGMVLVGIAIVLKTEWIMENIGANAWAEEKFGTSGGSRLFYKLLGILLILIGFMMITGLFGPLLVATVGKLFIPT